MRRLMGAAVRRQTAKAPEDASGLSELTVKDLDGQDVKLGSFWADGPAVLVFLRHYG